jgi:hypothetical protein
MKIFITLANQIQNLNKKDFEKYLIISLIGIFFIGSLFVYQIYRKSTYLIQQIKNTEKLAQKASTMFAEYERLQQKEEQLQNFLKQNKEFNMNTFFEQFYKEQNMNPEANWSTVTVPIEGNENFDEVSLNATFKNQTTEKLTKMLDALDKKENIYIKDLVIRNTMNKKIDFDISIASMRFKRTL